MKISNKNKQCSCLLKILATILVQTGTALTCEPKDDLATIVNIEITTDMTQISSQSVEVEAGVTEYLSNKYVILSNEFHRMLEEDKEKLNINRLQFLLSSARDFKWRAEHLECPDWVRQFKVLSTSLEVAIELEQARMEQEKHKKTHEDK